jgi:hypothetical protein
MMFAAIDQRNILREKEHVPDKRSKDLPRSKP